MWPFFKPALNAGRDPNKCLESCESIKLEKHLDCHKFNMSKLQWEILCQHDNGHSADLGIKSTQDDGVRRLSQNQSEKSKRIDVAEDLARINGSHANWNLKKYNALGWPHISQIKFSCQNLDALRKTFMLSAVHAHLAGTWAIYLSIFWAMSIHHTENKYACTMEPKDWEGRIASMFWPWQWRWADQSIKSH